jgi:hypothetical protein
MNIVFETIILVMNELLILEIVVINKNSCNTLVNIKKYLKIKFISKIFYC